MTTGALLLVFGSAFIHATWNMAAKKAGGGIIYVFFVGFIAALFWAPIGIWLLATGKAVDAGASMVAALGATAVSSLLHGLYFSALQKGYSVGDMSLVYPLARGTGPMISTLVAMWVYAERPSMLALAGAILIASGAFALTRPAPSSKASLAMNGEPSADAAPVVATPPAVKPNVLESAMAWGLITGVFIAGYTLWDKYALSVVGVNPLFLEWGTTVGRAVVLGPVLALAPRSRAQLIPTCRQQWKPAFAVAVLSPVSYMMALTALKTSPVSYVAPMREMSILIGTVFGARLLGEGDAQSKRLRAIAAGAMALGVAALALG